MILQEHADISHLSGFHTSAKARYFIEYNGKNLDELKDAARFATENSLPILTISGGKNLLLAFDEYPGLIIHNNSKGYKVVKTPFLKGEKNKENRERGICFLNKSSASSVGTSFKKEDSLKTPFLKGDVRLGGQGDLLNLFPAWNFTETSYRPDLTEKARELRKKMTGPEKKIWYSILKNDTFKGLRFLRQKPLLDYIVDFYCDELGLVIELDGFSHHGTGEYDRKRTEDLEKHGLTVARFSNDEVLLSFESVCDNLIKIVETLKNKSSVPMNRDTSFKKEATSDICIHVASGHPIWELAESLEKEHDITLWHRFLGLPGSIAGAVFGNAGCFGLEVGPYVERVYILDLKTGMELEKTGVELDFKYRWSECKNHPEWFLLSVDCDLSALKEKYPAPPEDPLAWRERVQPEGYSCGSFFKNPSREQSAGSLLEQSGLKGFHLGGAYFSDKHANFLMSDGTATWQDLIALIELAQTKVHEQAGHGLEPEVRIIRL